VASHAGDDCRCVADRLTLQTETSDRILAIFGEQCAMDHLGLVRPGVCAGRATNRAGDVEYSGRVQERCLSPLNASLCGAFTKDLPNPSLRYNSPVVEIRASSAVRLSFLTWLKRSTGASALFTKF